MLPLALLAFNREWRLLGVLALWYVALYTAVFKFPNLTFLADAAVPLSWLVLAVLVFFVRRHRIKKAKKDFEDAKKELTDLAENAKDLVSN